MGYGFYFVLGYYLNCVVLSKRQITVILVIGTIGFVLATVLNAMVSMREGEARGVYHDNLSLCILLESVLVIVLFKALNYKNERLNSFVAKLSKYSFGAYLVHLFVIKVFSTIGFDTFLYKSYKVQNKLINGITTERLR